MTLCHPQIASVLDVVVESDALTLVMELAAGHSLRDQLKRRGPLSCQRATQIVTQLAHALHHAHGQGMLHLGLSPERVVVDPQGGVRLLAFPIEPPRELVGRRASLTATSAPEVLRGELSKLGPATDVYALGALLYELLTQRAPEETEEGRLPPPSLFQPEIPPAIDRVCLTCLAADPEERYPNPQALADALGSASAGSSGLRSWSLGTALALLVASPLLGMACTLLAQRVLSTHPQARPAPSPAELVSLPATPVPSELVEPPWEPSTAPAYQRRGRMRRYQGDLQAALANFDLAIGLDPDSTAAYSNRGLTRSELGDLQGALEDYTRVLELDPNRAQTYYNRANLKSDLGDLVGAVADYTRALELDPRDKQTYFNRASAHSSLGDDERAIADLTRALELDPRYLKAYNSRGNVYYRLDRYEEALRDFGHRIELDPQDPDAYYNRGNTHSAMGAEERAIDDYDRAIELDPGAPQAYTSRGSSREELGDHEGALDDFNFALELAPTYAKALYYRALLHASRGRYQESIEDSSRAIEHASSEEWLNKVFVNRGNMHYHLGDMAKALEDYNRACEANPQHGQTLALRGMFRSTQGDRRGGIEDLERALTLIESDDDKSRSAINLALKIAREALATPSSE